MLEAEISPILGMTLLELVEWVAFATIAAGFAAAVGIGISIYNLITSSNESKKQGKVASANLVLELLKPWRQDEFQKLIDDIYDPTVTEYDERVMENFLNHFEDIAVLEKDGTLSTNHVKEFFGANLKAVRDDERIQSYIKKWTDKNSDYYFVNLRELIKKVDDWKI